jgi:HEAT repeat protein
MTTKRKAAKSAKSARRPKGTPKMSAKAAHSIATNPQKTVKQRVAAMSQVPLSVVENDENPQAVLSVLRNKDEPVKVRLAALQQLAAASFSAAGFESWRGDYIVTLREVATDPDPEIRQRALGLLARENDGFAQKKLLEGLQNPEKALVPPEKALQLLGYDVHAEAYSVARDIVSNPPNDDARREALRLLAADANSAPLFEKLLRDKGELREIRQIAASALHSLQPAKLQKHAREMLLDKSEYDDIQATSLTALSQFGDDAAIADDKALLKSVDRVSGKAASTKYKKSARQFLSKYRR